MRRVFSFIAFWAAAACGALDDAEETISASPAGATIIGPGAVSSDAREFAATLTPDGNSLYFNRVGAEGGIHIWRARFDGESWRAAELFVHSDQRFDDIDPFVSRSGDRLYFTSNRPLPEAAFDPDTDDLWYAPRLENGGWGAPVHAGPDINGPDGEVFVSEDVNGVLYFAVFGERAGDGRAPVEIHSSSRDGENFTPAAKVEIPLPENMRITNPAVAPDGSYIVFAGRVGDNQPDLVVSRRRPDGTWAAVQSLGGAVNLPDVAEFAPYVSNDGARILFTSDRRRGEDGVANWDLYEASLQLDG
ncbi:MAG: hypothetical protein AAFW68_01735 [Pseudomonadota bacterium]